MKEKLSYEFGARRAGDVPKLIANPSKALTQLKWKATKTLDQMCEDSYRFVCCRLKKND